MNKYLFSLIILLFSFTTIEAKSKYYASVCAIFQNEAPYLKEWIEYHRLLGFEHFYLYNNNSEDDYQSVLTPYISKGVVELIQWPATYVQNFDPVQKGAYNDCINRCKEDTSWLAIIDIDEYIVPIADANIRDFLKHYSKKSGLGGIMISWIFYGTSYLPSIPDDKLMIESLVRRVAKDHPWNKNCKTICKPKRVRNYHVHGAEYIQGYHDISTTGKGGPQPPVFDKIRINHYWTRADDFFYNVKAPRRAKFGDPWTPDVMNAIIRDTNVVEDKVIFKYVPQLRRKVFGTSA